MVIRQSIIISLILHTALMSAIFSINYRERVSPLPVDCMLVSLVEEFSGDKVFSIFQNYKGNGYPEKIKRPPKHSSKEEKSPTLSVRMADGKGLRKTKENKEGYEDEKDGDVASFSESKTKTDEGDKGGLDTNHDLSLFQNIQAESQYSGMSGEIFSHQGIKSSLLNTHPRDSGNSDLLRAIRSSIERAASATMPPWPSSSLSTAMSTPRASIPARR